MDALLVAQYYAGLITSLPGCSWEPTPIITPVRIPAPTSDPNQTVDPDGLFIDTYVPENKWVKILEFPPKLIIRISYKSWIFF